MLKKGDPFTFTINRGVGTETCVSVNYDDFVNDVEIGDTLLIDGTSFVLCGEYMGCLSLLIIHCLAFSHTFFLCLRVDSQVRRLSYVLSQFIILVLLCMTLVLLVMRIAG